MRVARVIARLGETIVDVAQVTAGERYTIGSGRDVRLAIAGVAEFALVRSEARGFVVQRPVGDGRTCDEVVLGASRITVELGLVAIEISLVESAVVAVPRPEVERRTPAFVVASLIVHLLVWGTAITFGRVPRVKRSRPVKQGHPLIVRLAPASTPMPAPTAMRMPAEPPPKSLPTHPRIAAASPTSRRAGSEDHLPVDGYGNADPAAAIAKLNAVTEDGYIGKMLDQVGPVYVPSAVDQPFGDVERMDPKTRPGWGALKIVTGRYRTIDVHDPIPASQGLALCESRRCEVTGGLGKDDVQRVAATRGFELERCVNRGAVMLDLDIAADGHVTKVQGEGKGARCAADVIATLAFPAAEGATHAAFTIGYP